jgi:hypothetical protein
MPKGVEHNSIAAPMSAECPEVIRPLMPKGVEHTQIRKVDPLARSLSAFRG